MSEKKDLRKGLARELEGNQDTKITVNPMKEGLPLVGENHRRESAGLGGKRKKLISSLG